MLKFLYSLLTPSRPPLDTKGDVEVAAPPEFLAVEGADPFAFAENIDSAGGLPLANWTAVSSWIERIESPDSQALAWAQSELAWLAHLQATLGSDYRTTSLGRSLLLSTLEPNVSRATLEFMSKTLVRIDRVLGGLAQSPQWGHDILIVFDEDHSYYRYVSMYYPDAGDFAASGGMYLNHGCGHFVTMKSDLRVVEPVIAHEMIHACLSHLPIPAWLNEGLAVNTEQRLCPAPPSGLTPQQMHAKHVSFWGSEEIQEFWSGKSFLRPDDGNMLSYDLARILVSQFAADWTTFKDFVLSASLEDAGEASATQHLGVSLGAAVCAVLERDRSPDWGPNPARWHDSPERGAFHGDA